MYIACNEIGDEEEKYLRDVLQYNICRQLKNWLLILYQISDQDVAYVMNGFHNNRVNK